LNGRPVDVLWFNTSFLSGPSAANCHIVFVCIISWASGSNPWGPERDDQFMRPTHYDGMLEVVGITGMLHMGQIGSGLRTAMRIAQGGHVSSHFHCYSVLAATVAFCLLVCHGFEVRSSKGKKVKTSICIARLMHKTPLTRISSLKLSHQAIYLGHRPQPANTGLRSDPTTGLRQRQPAVGLHHH